MSPPIYTPDGSEVSEIVLPDGSTASEVIGPDGNVVFEAGGDIPDSVEYQWRAEDFADPWPANVSNVDMTINGLTSSTFSDGSDSVAGDGTDDYGTADGPETMFGSPTVGWAYTFNATSAGQFGARGDGGNPQIQHRWDGGEWEFVITDNNGNGTVIQTNGGNNYLDGNTHLVVINKPDDEPSNMSVYIDDMTTEKSYNIENDQGFNSSNFTPTAGFGFFAWQRHDTGGFENYWDVDIGVHEFNSQTYSETERTDLKSRRPEV